MIVGEAVDAVARSHMAEARAPERQRVDQRLAQDDLFRHGQRLLHSTRPGAVPADTDAAAFPRAVAGVIFRPYISTTSPSRVEDRDHHRAVEVLVPALAQDAELLQPAAQFRARSRGSCAAAGSPACGWRSPTGSGRSSRKISGRAIRDIRAPRRSVSASRGSSSPPATAARGRRHRGSPAPAVSARSRCAAACRSGAPLKEDDLPAAARRRGGS